MDVQSNPGFSAQIIYGQLIPPAAELSEGK